MQTGFGGLTCPAASCSAACAAAAALRARSSASALAWPSYMQATDSLRQPSLMQHLWKITDPRRGAWQRHPPCLARKTVGGESQVGHKKQ